MPVPQTGTEGAPASLASCSLRIRAGHDVAGGEVEIVAGAVEVGRHRADEVGAELAAIGLAQLDAGDLGQGVPLVGGLQRAGEEVFLPDRLGAIARVDAGAAEEQELGDADRVGGADQVELDAQIVGEEVDRPAGVGQDAADPGGGDDDHVGLAARASRPRRRPRR